MSSSSSPAKFITLLGRLAALSVRNPRGLRYVLGHALAHSEEVVEENVDVTILPAVAVDELAAEQDENLNATIWASPRVRGCITLNESIGLAVLVRKIKARRIFEFGTYRGVSTTQLAFNLPEDGRVFTLDLPVSNLTTQFALDTPAEFAVVEDPRKGDLIPAQLKSKITFLAQDSAQFDPGPYEGSMDLVFVDGAHTPEYIRNDSEKGWRMVRPGGILAWHDCRFNSPSVIKFLRQCSYQPRRLLGGTLAFAVKPAK